MKSLNEYYGLENDDISHPTNYKTIMRNKQKDKQNNKFYSIQNFHGANKKYSLFYKTPVIPKQLEKQVKEWYHNA